MGKININESNIDSFIDMMLMQHSQILEGGIPKAYLLYEESRNSFIRGDTSRAEKIKRLNYLLHNSEIPFIKHKLVLDIDAIRDTAMHRILSGGAYEYETTAIMYWLLNKYPLELFCDIGANSGFYTILAGKLKPAMKILAFEPAPNLADVAERFAENNGVNADIRRLALGATKGSEEFYISSSDCSNSLRKGFRKAKDVVTVEVDTLNSVLAEYGPNVSLLKIDTETTEGDVFAGGLQWISRNRPFIICEVLWGFEDPRLVKFINECEYHPYQITANGLLLNQQLTADITYKHRDYLFSPQSFGNDELALINSMLK